ncbi:MAG: hypothetical protein ACOCPX_03510 [Halapricum sp.]
MSSKKYTRRDLMQKGAAGTGLVVLGSMAGCSDGGDGTETTPGETTAPGDTTTEPGETTTEPDETTTEPDETTTEPDETTTEPGNGEPSVSIRPSEIVPARAGAVVSMDVQAMLNDDDLRDMGDTVLQQLRTIDDSGDLPEDVDSAIEMAQQEADLDPTGFQQGLLFMELEQSDVDEEYVGIAMQTDWTESELVDSIESEGDESLQQSEYGGFPIYTSEDDEEGGLAVLSDGQYVLGTVEVLEGVIDVVNGDADPIAGELATLYDDTTAGHVAFATAVPEGALDEEDFQEDEVSLDNVDEIEYMSGSVYKTDTTYGLEMNMWTADAQTSEDLRDELDNVLSALTLSDEVDDDLADRINDIEVTVSGQTVTMSYEEDIEQVKTYVENNLMDLLFFILLGGGGTTI